MHDPRNLHDVPPAELRARLAGLKSLRDTLKRRHDENRDASWTDEEWAAYYRGLSDEELSAECRLIVSQSGHDVDGLTDAEVGQLAYRLLDENVKDVKADGH